MIKKNKGFLETAIKGAQAYFFNVSFNFERFWYQIKVKIFLITNKTFQHQNMYLWEVSVVKM